jgi:hypothetical protein
VLLGHGPSATGGAGWIMSADLYFECARCGYLMNGDPRVTDTCSCGALHKDSGAARFGSDLGDDAISVYRMPSTELPIFEQGRTF